MGKNFKKLFSIMCCTILVVATGCQNSATNEVNDVLNLAYTNTSNTLNSLKTSEAVNSKIIIQFGEGLVRRGLDDQIEAALAESWTISENKTVYTFTLRDTNWDNGTPLTAHDFVFAWRKVATLENAEQKELIYTIKNARAISDGELSATELGIKALDDKTLEVTLESPLPYIFELINSYPFYPVNEAFYENVGGDEMYGTTADTVQAIGAYKLVEYDGAVGYRLEKNENYWDKDNVAIETINVSVISEPTTQSVMYDNGEIDILKLDGSLIDQYEGNPDLLELSANGMEYIFLSGTTNTPAPLLLNKNFRAAIAHAIDKKVITENILKNGSTPADYIVAKNYLNIDGIDFRDMSGNWNDSYFNVDKAQEFLTAAKTELGDTPLTFTLTFPNSGAQITILENLKSQIETNLPGVTVEIELLPNQLFYPTLDELATPAARSGWTPGRKDPDVFLTLFRSDNFLNSAQYNNKDYDKLLAKTLTLEQLLEPIERWETFIEAEDMLLNDFVIIPLYQMGEKYLVNSNIKNWENERNTIANNYRFLEKG